MATRACGEVESRRGRLLRNPHKDVKHEHALVGGSCLSERVLPRIATPPPKLPFIVAQASEARVTAHERLSASASEER